MYVNDIIITGSDMTGISSLKSFLHDQFHIKDLGMLKYFFCVEVMRNKHEIFLSQTKYMLDILSEIGKLGGKPCSFSMAQSLHLTKEDKLFGDLERFRRPVGKLNYCTITCPDVAHLVSVVS